ncbi:MAG: hypothetical protein OHK0022_17860 [Roseiflexaceae bacterium]
MPRSSLPYVERDRLQRYDAEGRRLPPIRLGSVAWSAWLADQTSGAFSYRLPGGALTVRRERKGGRGYWYAYRRQGGRLRKAYLGRDAELTATRLREIGAALLGDHPAAGSAGVQLYLLGVPQILHGGRPARLSAAKALALLGYLAVEGAPRPREHLLDLLWPASAPAAARKNLRNTLWSIRAVLGEVVVEQHGRLALHPAVASDVALLARHAPPVAGAPLPAAEESTTAALLEGYRGPLLEGLTVAEAPDFELWLLEAREQVQQRYLRLVEALLVEAREAGGWQQVVVLAGRALAVDPLQEPFARALMRAHVALGQPVEALRRYEQLRAALERELGVAPAPETQALRRQLLDPAAQPVADYRRPSRVHTMLQPPFVGRVQERAALDEVLRTARSGGAPGLLIAGEPGVGKTRLWQVWSEPLRRTQPVVELRGSATARDIALAPLLAWLEGGSADRLLLSGGPLPDPAVQELVRLLPELARLRPDLPVLLPDPAAQRRGFAALTDLLAALGGDPPALFFDDLQWADPVTLAWLGYTMARRRSLPLLLIAAYRPQDLDEQRAQLLNAWELDGLAQRLPLPRLAPHETHALLSALDCDPERMADVARQSQGNPYFLNELLRAAPGTIPGTLRNRIAQCVVDLPAETRQVLEAAALLDPHITPALLRRVSGRSETEALEGLERFARTELVVAAGGHYAFAHPLVAAAIRQDLSPARRTVLLQRVAATRPQERAS